MLRIDWKVVKCAARERSDGITILLMQAVYRSIILFSTHMYTLLSCFSGCPLQCKNGGQVDQKTCTCTCYGKWKGADCSGKKYNTIRL